MTECEQAEPAVKVRSPLKRRKNRAVPVALVALLALAAIGFALAPELDYPKWTVVNMKTVPRRTIQVKGVPQQWWLVDRGVPVEVPLDGPQKLRIEVRCLVEAPDRVPYVIEATVDGKPLDWFRFMATPQPELTVDGLRVCDRDRIQIRVPEGSHTVGVRILAGDVSRMIVRFRTRVGGD